MTLQTYLKKHGISIRQFADLIGVRRESARRYAAGERVPRPTVMRRIRDVTGGKVTADSFVDSNVDRAA